MNDAGIAVSLFIAPDPQQVEAAARVGSQFIELHTGAFAEDLERRTLIRLERKTRLNAPIGVRRSVAGLQRLISAAKQAHGLGLKVNAGHGLNYQNLPALLRAAPGGIEHRPQHPQPRVMVGPGHRR